MQKISDPSNYKVLNYQGFETSRGWYFSCEIKEVCKENKSGFKRGSVSVEQRGDGGCNHYLYTSYYDRKVWQSLFHGSKQNSKSQNFIEHVDNFILDILEANNL